MTHVVSRKEVYVIHVALDDSRTTSSSRCNQRSLGLSSVTILAPLLESPSEMLHCVPTGFAPRATYFDAETARVTRWLDEERHGLEAMVRLFKEHSNSLQDFDDNL